MGRLSDTDDRLEAIAEETAAKVAGKLSQAPTPAHYHHCENDPDGPAFKANSKIKDLDMRVGAIEKAREGEAGERRKGAQITAAAAAIGAIVATAAMQVFLRLFLK